MPHDFMPGLARCSCHKISDQRCGWNTGVLEYRGIGSRAVSAFVLSPKRITSCCSDGYRLRQTHAVGG